MSQDRIIAAYHANGGNISAVSRELGIHRQTVRKYISQAGIADRPIKGGQSGYREPIVRPLPEAGEIKRYILTSAQNNTKIHPKFWENLKAYANWIGAEIMVARYAYDQGSYLHAKTSKPGTAKNKEDLWYDPEVMPYICDDETRHGTAHYELAPGIVWCAEMNIRPTASRPLSDLLTYMGQQSIVVPHAKVAMKSVPTSRDEMPKFCYTTGTVTQRNYIQKKAGLKAEWHHAYGALLVEVEANGDWWARQLNATIKGSFFDCPHGIKGLAFVRDGEVYSGEYAEGLNWGDIHASEIDEWVAEMNWGKGGILDSLKPKYQFMHDLLSFRSQSHHDRYKFGVSYQKWRDGEDNVEAEIRTTANLLRKALRGGTKTIVVNSNHDRHGDRWLDEVDYRHDKANARLFLEAQLARVVAMDEKKDWEFLPWAMRRENVTDATFLARDESFTLCRDIECGWHGDDGPNGSRGTTQSLVNVGRKVNKGHDHAAAILDGVYSAGACSTSYAYQTGPSAQSISHIVTYPNGKRAIITVRGRKWRATGV